MVQPVHAQIIDLSLIHILNFAGNEAAAEETRSQCEALGVRALAVKGDVADAEACNALIAKAVSEFGGVDILVCNAGINRDNLLMRMSDCLLYTSSSWAA